MRKSVILPSRSFTWAPGPTGGRRWVPAQGLVLILKPPSDQIDSAMPQKPHTEAPQYSYESGKPVAGKGSSQTLLGEEKSPAYQPVVRRVSRLRANFAFAPLPAGSQPGGPLYSSRRRPDC